MKEEVADGTSPKTGPAPPPIHASAGGTRLDLS